MVEFFRCDRSARASKADARRQHILDTARTLFSRQGFHRTGVAQIAAASGIAVGQLYRDFASKEDVIAAIVSRDVPTFLHEDMLAGALARDDAVAVRAWLDRMIADDEPVEDCCMICEILAEAGRNPRIAEINQSVESRARANIAAALRMLLPAIPDEPQLSELTELVQLLSVGLVSRRLAASGRDVRGIERMAARILDSEIERLRQGRATD